MPEYSSLVLWQSGLPITLKTKYSGQELDKVAFPVRRFAQGGGSGADSLGKDLGFSRLKLLLTPAPLLPNQHRRQETGDRRQKTGELPSSPAPNPYPYSLLLQSGQGNQQGFKGKVAPCMGTTPLRQSLHCQWVCQSSRRVRASATASPGGTKRPVTPS